MLEHGEDFEDAIIRELEEEMGIPADACRALKFCSLYRNIPNDGFDWVIGIWTIEVHGLGKLAENREPDKHDYVKVMPLYELWDWLNDHNAQDFAPNLSHNLLPVVRNLMLNAPFRKR